MSSSEHVKLVSNYCSNNKHCVAIVTYRKYYNYTYIKLSYYGYKCTKTLLRGRLTTTINWDYEFYLKFKSLIRQHDTIVFVVLEARNIFSWLRPSHNASKNSVKYET